MSEIYVGIDVSKDRLDVAMSDGQVLQVDNDDGGHRWLSELFGAQAGAWW